VHRIEVTRQPRKLDLIVFIERSGFKQL